MIALMVGCNDLENYSVSPNHHLSFSADTLSFDTVFTTVGSTTGHFMIYNKNDEALKISKILLASGGRSGFRINVDGRKGDNFSDIPIWKKDSLFVAVEVTVDPNDDNSPFVIYDSVVFTTNGTVQSVLLEAYGQNAHIIRGGTTIESDRTLTSERPYLVYDSIMIPEGVTVNIDKGALFYMHKDAKWVIKGTIKTNGTQEEPVTFRGDRLRNLTETISYDKVSAQWNGLFFGASSFENELNYTMIRNGISGLTFEESTPDNKKMEINNSQITNMDGNVLSAVNCHIEASNTELSNASNHLLVLSGGKYLFNHCTMANYMPPAMISKLKTRMSPTLTLVDTLQPLSQAYFNNCIIDGSFFPDTTQKYSGEIMFITDDANLDGNDGQFNYRFNNCVIKTTKVENERFIENIYLRKNADTDSVKFIKSNERSLSEEKEYDYLFDFRLANESPAIGKADRSISEQYPADRFGVNRLMSEYGPSIGAYEYVRQEENKEKK